MRARTLGLSIAGHLALGAVLAALATREAPAPHASTTIELVPSPVAASFGGSSPATAAPGDGSRDGALAHSVLDRATGARSSHSAIVAPDLPRTIVRPTVSRGEVDDADPRGEMRVERGDDDGTRAGQRNGAGAGDGNATGDGNRGGESNGADNGIGACDDNAAAGNGAGGGNAGNGACNGNAASNGNGAGEGNGAGHGIGDGRWRGIGLGDGARISEETVALVTPPAPAASRARVAKLVYPVREREADDAELFIARVTIDDEGFVVGAKLVRGFGGPRDAMAADLIWKFRYAPALDDEGRPVSSTLDQKFLVGR